MHDEIWLYISDWYFHYWMWWRVTAPSHSAPLCTKQDDDRGNLTFLRCFHHSAPPPPSLSPSGDLLAGRRMVSLLLLGERAELTELNTSSFPVFCPWSLPLFLLMRSDMVVVSLLHTLSRAGWLAFLSLKWNGIWAILQSLSFPVDSRECFLW